MKDRAFAAALAACGGSWAAPSAGVVVEQERDRPCDFAATDGISPSRYCLPGQCEWVCPKSRERVCPHGMACDREGRCLHPVKP